jgi:hypothetical protein
MRRRQVIKGFKNSQRIRVILDGIGFNSTVQDALEGPFTIQNTVIQVALEKMINGSSKSTGFATRVTTYDSKMRAKDFDIQIDLI